MPRYEKNGRSIETSMPSEGVRLRAEGWRELKARTAAVREADAERQGVDAPEAVEPVVEQPTPETPEAQGDSPKRSRSK